MESGRRAIGRIRERFELSIQRVARGQAIAPGWLTHLPYHGLDHPDLTGQLQRWMRDREISPSARGVAIVASRFAVVLPEGALGEGKRPFKGCARPYSVLCTVYLLK